MSSSEKQNIHPPFPVSSHWSILRKISCLLGQRNVWPIYNTEPYNLYARSCHQGRFQTPFQIFIICCQVIIPLATCDFFILCRQRSCIVSKEIFRSQKSAKKTITTHLNSLNTKETTTCDVGNQGPRMGQSQTCDGVKLVNEIPIPS